MFFGHIKPRTISKCWFEERKKSTLKYYGLHFFVCIPFLAVDEVATDVHKVLDLLVSLFLIFEVSCDVECLADLAWIANSFALLFVHIFLHHATTFAHLLLLFFYLLFWRVLAIVIDSRLLTTDLSEAVKNTWKQTALHGSIAKFQIVRNGEGLWKDFVVELDCSLLLFIPTNFGISGFSGISAWELCVRWTCKNLEQEILAPGILQEKLEEQRYLGEGF